MLLLVIIAILGISVYHSSMATDSGDKCCSNIILQQIFYVALLLDGPLVRLE